MEATEVAKFRLDSIVYRLLMLGRARTWEWVVFSRQSTPCFVAQTKGGSPALAYLTGVTFLEERRVRAKLTHSWPGTAKAWAYF